MNNLQTLMRIWRMVASYYIFAFLSVMLVAWWFGVKWAIALALIEVFFHICWWIELKSKLLQNITGEFRCLPTHPEEFVELDLESLQEYTKQLVEDVSFIHIVDYRLDEQANGFARLLKHPQHYCFADIFQIFSSEREPTAVLLTIHSTLEDGWTLSTTVVKPNGLSHIWRNDKNLWTYHPDAKPAELLLIHLKRRQQIIEDLGVNILTDLSWEFYFIQQQKSSIKRRENFEKKNIAIGLIEATRFEMNPPSEWMGKYPKVAAKRKANKSNSIN